MFDISIWELLVVCVLGLVVIGPKQIPQVAYKIGQWIAYLKNAWYALSSELRSQMQTDIVDKSEDKSSDSEKPS